MILLSIFLNNQLLIEFISELPLDNESPPRFEFYRRFAE